MERKAGYEKERRIMAVGAIIMADDGRILIVQETQDKPVIDKKTGDWSFPIETLGEGELPLEGLERLLDEEVGSIGLGDVDFVPERDWIGDYNVNPEHPIWGRVYLLQARGSSENFTGHSSVGGEVINHRWVFPRGLQGLPRRKGVWEPLKDFLTGQRGVICTDCIPGMRE